MNQDLKQIKKRYNIVGNSRGLNHAINVCLQVAATDLSVLVVGESGVGKEILPRIIHDHSPRKKGKYFAINCGSIPEGTIDSELFGHEKGSFTGAVGEREGYFGVADGGTLFLDEVGELPLATQARLLRVLETGEYIRVGGQEVRKTNVRIVAATNVNMRKAISEGRFREDLYYRLNTIPVHMPPLRDRENDILLLFRLFSTQMTEKYRTERLELTPEAQRLLLKYKWPGNVRQLKNITEQIAILAPESKITEETLLQFIPDDEETTQLSARSVNPSGSARSYENERQLLFNFLFELQANITALSNDVEELKRIVAAIGGTPVQKPVRALLPEYREQGGGYGLRIKDDGLRISEEGLEIKDDGLRMKEEQGSEAYEEAEAEELTATDSENLNIHQTELEQIRKALARNNGNRKKAAEELGISDRTLYRRLKEM